MNARISTTFQTVVRGPNFTGAGKRPLLQPASQQLLETGMIGGIGGSAFGDPMI
jgi:hypothetical protein